jgi:hypothetical protein
VIDRTRARACVISIAALAILAGCMHAGREPHVTRTPRAPRSDSATVGLWRFDELAGHVAVDSGPARLDAATGADTRTDFGRYGNARAFAQSIESFALVPYVPALETGRSISIEAWVKPSAFGRFEDTPIAARWTEQANVKSWMFSIVGGSLTLPGNVRRSPGYHAALTQGTTAGRLMFAFQPDDASAPQAFFSSKPVELDRWTHVAVTYDGEIVRFYIDALLDSQHAYAGTIRATPAPLMIANYFDPRWLSDFGGDLRVSTAVDREPYYAYEGLIDELRISNVARVNFWSPPRE